MSLAQGMRMRARGGCQKYLRLHGEHAQAQRPSGNGERAYRTYSFLLNEPLYLGLLR